ncbi:hypothetical protein [Sediminibacterium goheungense]|uniref:Uncharacterized protein n=1 Tax=Sediminibacterium goheungense TaxID=1086393 RepID=A0A4R6J2I0_9BACT|nr:hypothetical protein [Sediminibacterium goheungense]TDO29453.1 hypothetical protein BC659_1543 [Sediminibacterium goheungense]
MNIRELLHFEEEGKIALKEEKTLRLIVGILGMLLPFLLYFSVAIYSDYYSVMPSISHYYFTRGSFFLHLVVIIFSLILIIYKGYDQADFWLSSTAGFAGLLLLFFPTDNIEDYLCGKDYLLDLKNRPPDLVITQMKNSSTANIHLISAAIFFLSLAIMSIFFFTRVRPRASKETVYLTRGRVIQNRIYYVCGFFIITPLVIMILAGTTSLIDPVYYETNHFTFWLECIALIAFAFSWFTKSNTIIKGSVIKESEYQQQMPMTNLKKDTV